MYHLEDTHWWYMGMRHIVFDFLAKYATKSRDGSLSILDAGCGTGGMLKHLQKLGQATGIDACEEALEFCRQRGLQRLALASVTDIPFADTSFDLIVSFDVLYHKNVRDDVAAMREFHRLLKPGGHLLIRLPAYNWLRGSHDEAVHTRQRYDSTELRQKMSRAGFQVTKVTYANSILFPLAATKRLTEMAFGLRSKSDVKEVSPLLNRTLAMVLGIEARLLNLTSLPWGLSVFALGKAL